MKCIFCQKGLAEGVALYRINQKGVPGVWACLADRPKTDAPIDPEVDRLIRAIEGRPI